MNIDALQETTSSKKDCHYETRGKTPLNIEKIINTPQALTFHLSRTYHRVPPSLIEASKSYSMVDKLKYVLDDYPSRPKNRALREMQEASLKTISDAILTKKTAVGDFSPIFSLADVKNKNAFMSAIDKQYAEQTFSHNEWVKALKESLTPDGTEYQEKNNNCSVLHALVAIDTGSRLRLAIRSREFLNEIRALEPGTLHQVITDNQAPIDRPLQPRNTADAEQFRQAVESKVKKREILVQKAFENAESALLKLTERGCKADMKYVQKVIENARNLTLSEEKELKRKLKIIVRTEEAFNHLIVNKVTQNADPLLTETLLASDVNVTEIFNAKKVKKLTLTAEEKNKLITRFTARKIKIYNEDQGHSVFFREQE